ncbi:putative cytochrome oxidase subunit [Cronobacter dublinensis 1210]|nr:putative cytochrome oxidase subunit [Cronobacter dublinensis 1210]
MLFPACHVTGAMRNTTNMIVTQADTAPAVEETTWAWPGAVVGFISWLLALGVPFLLYGSNTLFFLLYTWPFFLALMPVAVVVGVAVFSLLERKLVYSSLATLISVGLMFGLLFFWLVS